MSQRLLSTNHESPGFSRGERQLCKTMQIFPCNPNLYLNHLHAGVVEFGRRDGLKIRW